MEEELNNEKIVYILAFVAGFLDASTFVSEFGVFSAHVTGNFILFAISLFQENGLEFI